MCLVTVKFLTEDKKFEGMSGMYTRPYKNRPDWLVFSYGSQELVADYYGSGYYWSISVVGKPRGDDNTWRTAAAIPWMSLLFRDVTISGSDYKPIFEGDIDFEWVWF